MNPNDKPITMPLRDFLIKQVAIEKSLHYSIIDAIITHQFDAANEATHTVKSLELSGFGRFVFSESKAQNQMKKFEQTIFHLERHLQEPDLKEKDLLLLQKKLQGTLRMRDELKKRML